MEKRIVFISPALKKILIKHNCIKDEYFKDKGMITDNYFSFLYRRRIIIRMALGHY